MNRWLSARFNLLSSAVIGITAFVAVLTPTIDASLAGFALAFATSLLSDVSGDGLSFCGRVADLPPPLASLLGKSYMLYVRLGVQ